MTTITLQEAQANLAELVHRLAPGEAVTITENDRPVAQLIPTPIVRQRPPRPRPPVTGVPNALAGLSRAGSLQGLLPGAPTDPGVHVKCTRFVTLWNRCPPHDWVVSR